ncbi:MAG: hypothetical protein AB2825_03425, partial [Candidatus Thiodiazotropha endolucinida]
MGAGRRHIARVQIEGGGGRGFYRVPALLDIAVDKIIENRLITINILLGDLYTRLIAFGRGKLFSDRYLIPILV